MIEQSLKLVTRAYVFEPNGANTWVKVKSMMISLLIYGNKELLPDQHLSKRLMYNLV
jgi:hypothetical protein